MSYIEELRNVIPVLEEAYEVAKARIEIEMPDVNPLVVRSTDGRFILLDCLIAIVNAKTAVYEWDRDIGDQ